MEFEDFGKPVTNGRAGRVIVGVIFLVFAAAAAYHRRYRYSSRRL
jgi:hypothetical protein